MSAWEESVHGIKTGTNGSNFSVTFWVDICMKDRESFATYTAYLVAVLLLTFPLLILVLHVALQRWRSTMTIATGHMDVLTYHMVLLELLGVAGACAYFCSLMTEKAQQWGFSIIVMTCTGIGKSVFHLLACLDRYLAVVHPIRYVWTRQSAGIRLRNVSIVCAWLLCLPVSTMKYIQRCIYSLFFLFFSVLFSSGTLYVLFVMSCAGPKGESRNKRRALHTVAAITTTLVLRFLGNLVPVILLATWHLSLSQQCLMAMMSLPFLLPASLVMPLLFLQRAGKLHNCQHTSISEREESS